MPMVLKSFRPRLKGLLYAALVSAGSILPALTIQAESGVATNGVAAPAPQTQAREGEPFLIPDLKLELLWVKPGEFTMGSPSDEPQRNKAEGPQTRVKITRGFWLGKTEVTQGQYEKIAEENPSQFKEAGENRPVERVSWRGAMAYCKKLNERERAAGRLPLGYEYTLPTEAQWEYAYRAGTTGEYPDDADAMAWHEANSEGKTHPVAQRRANQWGFYDMAGNVLEWTYDWFGPYPGGTVSDPKGPRRGYYRTGRGGSWRTELRLCRSAGRSGGSEGREDYTIGFRIALSKAE